MKDAEAKSNFDKEAVEIGNKDFNATTWVNSVAIFLSVGVGAYSLLYKFFAYVFETPWIGILSGIFAALVTLFIVISYKNKHNYSKHGH